MTEKRAKNTLEKRYKKQNDYNKIKYDRVSVMLPAGVRDRLRAAGVVSLNGFIVDLVLSELEKMEG